MVMDVRVGLPLPGVITVRLVEPEMLLSVAAMVVDPAATPDANPAELMVAADWLLEDQVAEEVTFCVVASV